MPHLSEKFLAASRLALGLPPAPPAATKQPVEQEEADDYRAAVRRHFAAEAKLMPPRWSAPGPSAPRRSSPARSSQSCR